MPHIDAEQFAELKQDVKEIKSALLGDTTRPNDPGFLERLRRVEAWQGREKWLIGASVVAALTAAAKAWLHVN